MQPYFNVVRLLIKQLKLQHPTGCYIMRFPIGRVHRRNRNARPFVGMQHFVTSDIYANMTDFIACTRYFKENKIPFLQIAFRHFITFSCLSARYSRQFNAIFTVYVLSEAGAIES